MCATNSRSLLIRFKMIGRKCVALHELKSRVQINGLHCSCPFMVTVDMDDTYILVRSSSPVLVRHRGIAKWHVYLVSSRKKSQTCTSEHNRPSALKTVSVTHSYTQTHRFTATGAKHKAVEKTKTKMKNKRRLHFVLVSILFGTNQRQFLQLVGTWRQLLLLIFFFFRSLFRSIHILPRIPHNVRLHYRCFARYSYVRMYIHVQRLCLLRMDNVCVTYNHM